MALFTDKHDYRKAFFKHAISAKKLSSKENKHSLNLLLSYCVECGLKHQIMEKYNIFKIEDARDDIKRILHEHDFEKLLYALDVGEYKFHHFTNNHNENVNAKNYHEFCRYGLSPKATKDFSSYENILSKIVEWLKEEV